MMVDVTKFDNDSLTNFIKNHRDKNATDLPEYKEALEELARRKGNGLDFDKSFNAIRQAAMDGRFMSYGELAEKSGADWNKVRYAMNEHLGSLVEFAHRNGWPLLSAIVVNQKGLETGELESSSLKGFVTAARALGIPVTDEKAFLKEQQRRVFEWGKELRLSAES